MGALLRGQSLWNGLRSTGSIFHPPAPRSAALGWNFQQTRSFIQMRSILKVADNSGAKFVGCIKVIRGSKGGWGKLGDIIVASVKEVVSHKRRLKKFDTKDTSKVKKGEVVRAVIVRAKMQRSRRDGSQVQFDENAVVIINKDNEPVGTRVFGPVAAELRAKKFVKILSLAEHVDNGSSMDGFLIAHNKQ